MPLYADANGVVTGKFTIPANVPAGLKEAVFNGSGGSFGTATFLGQGTWVENVMQEVTNVTRHYYDPLAQTFILDQPRQIGGVDLFVTAMGPSDLIVQIRETIAGVPSQKIVGETRLKTAQVTVNDWNRFAFESPITIPQNVEHAIVILSNDAVTEVGISELGKWDLVAGRWVTSQPYNVGVLLSSANASTWTAHQDRKLTFRLLAARYTQTSRTINLGTITANNTTDMIVSALTDSPSTGADANIAIDLGNGNVRRTGDRQVLQLTGPISGPVPVSVELRATPTMSASISPGSQIISGALGSTGVYVSRAFEADAFQSDVRVIVDANLPSGSTMKVFVSGTGESDTWQEMTLDASPKALGDGIFEFNYFLEDVNKAALRVKIEFTGTAAARPRAANLRVSIT